MTMQWLVWALAALLLGFVVAWAALVLAAARAAWRRDHDLGGLRGWYPGSVLRLRGAAAVTVGGLVALLAGTYAAVISLGLLKLVLELWS
ncbi:MAG: hypothetical protein EXR99_07480 [Gemmataceae bacterium]|nr:hypothetical protein [Gemmataceae bacterium]